VEAQRLGIFRDGISRAAGALEGRTEESVRFGGSRVDPNGFLKLIDGFVPTALLEESARQDLADNRIAGLERGGFVQWGYRLPRAPGLNQRVAEVHQ